MSCSDKDFVNCGGIQFLVSAVARILAFIAVVIFVIRVNKIAGCLPFLGLWTTLSVIRGHSLKDLHLPYQAFCYVLQILTHFNKLQCHNLNEEFKNYDVVICGIFFRLYNHLFNI